ncbi:N-acetyldiaminopimelate deacetylase [Aquibacillus sp. 3ASR75-11]|uniref:N-acetyldiaminopimelate deacetylase n=1 Tax=Terrihalobacillus insolitus TaxID=2950438 RepID=A0A9X3WTS9_9BACI|nr:N-acetyldiaminopimelate deacetylase [Terrihalobacillus insolitus]MDC3412757.1 N-acetyldiaminopimelate deacetylase [Terrihalobacillus insolitus]MDC3423766.1 N-acetyldiaminopimelate deacetylase [Terrihalobacillus insolitus]
MDYTTLQETRRTLHQIPELGFQEIKTQAYLLQKVERMKKRHVEVKQWRTGILVKVSGKNPIRTIGFRADIDGLPIHEATGLEFESMHKGNMHACGHDFHMTIALGVLERLINQPIDDDVVFIFQPAEEGPGGALPFLQSSEWKQWNPDVIFALHIAPELPVGTVSSRAGLLFANTSELFVHFKGKGGHAAYPHLTKDMVVTASSFVTQLQQIVSRKMDPLQSAVISIGKISGGFVQNVIAEEARIEGTIRTLKAPVIDDIKQNIEQMAKGFEISADCSISIDYGSNYYQVFNDANLVKRFKSTVEAIGVQYQEAGPAMTGEDFGYMLKEIPGFMFWLGVDSGYGLHHAKLNPKEEALQVGVDVVESTLRRL